MRVEEIVLNRERNVKLSAWLRDVEGVYGMDTLDADLNRAMLAVASAWVSDSRWPPAPE